MTVRIAGPPPGPGRPRFDRRRFRSRAVRLLRELGLSDSELSITLADDARMADLNGAWRGRARPTDVLSFSLLEGEHADFRGPLLGEVVIGVDTAARQAREARRGLDAELLRLLVHGVLHLLGSDHREPGEARRMRAEERRLWRALAR